MMFLHSNFPRNAKNFGDSHTFKADIGSLNLHKFSRPFALKWFLGQNMGKGDVMPQQTRFYFWEFLRLCQILVKINQEM